MKAAWYEKQGPAREVFTVGDMPDPAAGLGEVRIRIATSGINPGDIRKRQDDFGYPRHSLSIAGVETFDFRRTGRITANSAVTHE